MKSKLIVALAASSFLLAAPVFAAGSASNGQSLWSSKSCTMCHGANGTGGSAPTWAQMVKDYSTADTLSAFIQKSMPMTAPGTLSASDSADLAAYVEQGAAPATPAPSTPAPSTPAPSTPAPASTKAPATGSSANYLLYVGGSLLAGGALALKSRRLVKE